MVKDIAVGVQIMGLIPGLVRSDAVSTSLRRFFRAVLPRRKAAEMGSATRYTFRRNTAHILQIFCSFLGMCRIPDIYPVFGTILRFLRYSVSVRIVFAIRPDIFKVHENCME